MAWHCGINLIMYHFTVNYSKFCFSNGTSCFIPLKYTKKFLSELILTSNFFLIFLLLIPGGCDIHHYTKDFAASKINNSL